MQGFKFEDAMRLLVSHFPKETKKPALFHSMRVGTYLWNNNYSEDIQIAWLLHDALEDTSMTEEEILKLCWKEVLAIVQANSEDDSVETSLQKEDIVKRCAQVWENALIVKMADVYDNFKFYTQQENISELERCKWFVELILKYKKENWNDSIFIKADEIINS